MNVLLYQFRKTRIPESFTVHVFESHFIDRNRCRGRTRREMRRDCVTGGRAEAHILHISYKSCTRAARCRVTGLAHAKKRSRENEMIFTKTQKQT